MAAINSPNMGLPVPTVGSEPGPDYALDVNTSLSLIDDHDHSPGRGVPVTPDGMNISSSLSFNDNSATALQSIVFQSQGSVATPLALYVKPGSESPALQDLWYNDGSNIVQLTAGGLVNATIASLPGQSYSAGTFVWKQGSGSTTPANFDIGSITIRPNVALTTNGITLGPPSAISSAYDIQLPPNPSSLSGTSVMTLDSSGNMSTGRLATLGQVQSSSSGTFSTSSGSFVGVTNLSVTLNTTGRPVMILVQPDGNTSGNSNIGVVSSSSGQAALQAAGRIVIQRGGTTIFSSEIQTEHETTTAIQTRAELDIPPGCLSALDTTSTPGSNTYTVLVNQFGNGNSGNTISVINCILIAYEL